MAGTRRPNTSTSVDSASVYGGQKQTGLLSGSSQDARMRLQRTGSNLSTLDWLDGLARKCRWPISGLALFDIEAISGLVGRGEAINRSSLSV